MVAARQVRYLLIKEARARVVQRLDRVNSMKKMSFEKYLSEDLKFLLSLELMDSVNYVMRWCFGENGQLINGLSHFIRKTTRNNVLR